MMLVWCLTVVRYLTMVRFLMVARSSGKLASHVGLVSYGDLVITVASYYGSVVSYGTCVSYGMLVSCGNVLTYGMLVSSRAPQFDTWTSSCVQHCLDVGMGPIQSLPRAERVAALRAFARVVRLAA